MVRERHTQHSRCVSRMQRAREEVLRQHAQARDAVLVRSNEDVHYGRAIEERLARVRVFQQCGKRGRCHVFEHKLGRSARLQPGRGGLQQHGLKHVVLH